MKAFKEIKQKFIFRNIFKKPENQIKKLKTPKEIAAIIQMHIDDSGRNMTRPNLDEIYVEMGIEFELIDKRITGFDAILDVRFDRKIVYVSDNLMLCADRLIAAYMLVVCSHGEKYLTIENMETFEWDAEYLRVAYELLIPNKTLLLLKQLNYKNEQIAQRIKFPVSLIEKYYEEMG